MILKQMFDNRHVVQQDVISQSYHVKMFMLSTACILNLFLMYSMKKNSIISSTANIYCMLNSKGKGAQTLGTDPKLFHQLEHQMTKITTQITHFYNIHINTKVC